MLSLARAFLRAQWLSAVREVPLLGDNLPAGQSRVERVEKTPEDQGSAGGAAETPSREGRVFSLRSADVDDLESMLPPVADGLTRLYHGCSIYDATGILNEGIDIESLDPQGDFGAALYTTPDLACSIYYMDYRRTLLNADGAILVFDVNTAE